MAEEKKNPLIGAFRTPPPVKPPTEPVKPAIPQKITPPSVGGPLKATLPEKPDDKGKAATPEKSEDKGKAAVSEKPDGKGKSTVPEKPDDKGKTTVPEKPANKDNPAAQDKPNDKDKPAALEKKGDKSKADAGEPNNSDTIPDDFKLDIVPQGGITEVVMLPLSQIDDFENHPFPVVDDKEMDELVESVKRFGVLEATTVIPSEKAPGRYEMVAGHRRKHACLLAGKTEVPAIIRHMDRDTAILYMIDTNLKRKDLTPMQKARIYVMKLEAMKRKNGRPTKEDIAAGRVPMREDGVTPMRADEQLAKETGESRATIQRLTRLTKLEPELQEMVDKKVLPVNTAADISFLKKDEQKTLANAIQKEDKIPSGTQAAELKKASQAGSLTPEKIERTVAPTKREEIPPLKVTFSEEELRPYFPNKRTTLPDVKLAVFEGLKMRQMAIERKAQAAAKSTPDKKAPTR